MLGGDVFFLSHLALMTVFAARVTPDGLRARAAEEDEGLPLILLLTLAAIVLNLSAIFVVLNSQAGGFGLSTLVALVSVPLGWAAVHTLAAFHYANLFYAPHPDGGETRGLRFPGELSGAWRLLIFAFVIGMTAQVSDVAVASTLLRRVVLAHAVLSFFYYAVILAVAVNAAVNAPAQLVLGMADDRDHSGRPFSQTLASGTPPCAAKPISRLPVNGVLCEVLLLKAWSPPHRCKAPNSLPLFPAHP